MTDQEKADAVEAFDERVAQTMRICKLDHDSAVAFLSTQGSPARETIMQLTATINDLTSALAMSPQREIESLTTQLIEARDRVRLLAKAIVDIAIAGGLTDGMQSLTGPSVLVLVETLIDYFGNRVRAAAWLAERDVVVGELFRALELAWTGKTGNTFGVEQSRRITGVLAQALARGEAFARGEVIG